MGQFLEVLTFVIIGVILLWVGFTLFVKLGVLNRGQNSGKQQEKKPKAGGSPGDPKTCPVCSAKLSKGEMVSSAAFPSTNNGKDRFMYIRGCVYCLSGDRERVCPVCGTVLEANETLIARFFERPDSRSHIHVIGCTLCKGPRSGRPA